MFKPKYVRLLSNANVFYIEIMIKMKRNTTFYTYKMRTMKSRKMNTFLMIHKFSTDRRQCPNAQSE